MLDDYLNRDDVKEFIQNICNNERFFTKNTDHVVNYNKFVDREHLLFLIYDALYKYKVLFDDVYLFDEYLSHLDRLFKKITNLSDISIGIHKVLTSFCERYLDTSDQDKILKFVYDQYILNGYYLYGYPHMSKDYFLDEGITLNRPYVIDRKYDEIVNIFHSYGIELEPYHHDEIKLSDNMVNACLYAVNSPTYIFKFLTYGLTEEEEISAYFRDDYDELVKNINKICGKCNMSESDQKKIMDYFMIIWKYLRRDSYMYLVAIKRHIIDSEIPSFEDIIHKEEGLSTFDYVDKILGSFRGTIVYHENVSLQDIEFLKLPSYGIVVSDETPDDYKEEDEAMINENGKVTAFILVGSLLISLGVIIRMLMLFGK